MKKKFLTLPKEETTPKVEGAAEAPPNPKELADDVFPKLNVFVADDVAPKPNDGFVAPNPKVGAADEIGAPNPKFVAVDETGAPNPKLNEVEEAGVPKPSPCDVVPKPYEGAAVDAGATPVCSPNPPKFEGAEDVTVPPKPIDGAAEVEPKVGFVVVDPNPGN